MLTRVEKQARLVAPACAATEIDFSDYARSMHTDEHEGEREWVPAPLWANSNARLIHVVSVRLAIMGNLPFVPRSLEELRKVEPLIAKRLRKCESTQRHLDTVTKSGGIVHFWFSLAYRRFRLGMDSVQLGELYEIQPVLVRKHVEHLLRVARALYPDAGLHKDWHHTATNREIKPVNLQRFVKGYTHGANVLLAKGLTWREIEKRTGVSHVTLRKRLREAGAADLLPGRGKRPRKAVPAEVAALRAQGLTFREIGKRLGCSTMRAFYANKEASNGLA